MGKNIHSFSQQHKSFLNSENINIDNNMTMSTDTDKTLTFTTRFPKSKQDNLKQKEKDFRQCQKTKRYFERRIFEF